MPSARQPASLESLLNAMTLEQQREYPTWLAKFKRPVSAVTAKQFLDEVVEVANAARRKAQEAEQRRIAQEAQKRANIEELARLVRVAEVALSSAENFARDNGLPSVAANILRAYQNTHWIPNR